MSEDKPGSGRSATEGRDCRAARGRGENPTEVEAGAYSTRPEPLPKFRLIPKGPKQLEVCQTQACGKGQVRTRY